MMEYISQLIGYSWFWVSCHNFPDRVLLLTRNLLNQGFLVVKLKSLRKLFCSHRDLVNRYLYYKWPRICSVCRNDNPVLSSFMIYQRACNKCKRTGVTNRAGHAYPSVAPDLNPYFLAFCVVFCRSLFVFFCICFFLPLHCLSFLD
jgi:hypothetical protein